MGSLLLLLTLLAVLMMLPWFTMIVCMAMIPLVWVSILFAVLGRVRRYLLYLFFMVPWVLFRYLARGLCLCTLFAMRSVFPSSYLPPINSILSDSHELSPPATFVPLLRSGESANIGGRRTMEDASLCADDVASHFGMKQVYGKRPCALYGVFDGHGGKYAADYVSTHLPRMILQHPHFPADIPSSAIAAFLQTDAQLADNASSDSDLLESGTTAIVALIFGRLLVVANAGDCRAVLCRRGKAVEMSLDHKPTCPSEKERIKCSGGFVDDGYLNGELSVTRALGDWHIPQLKSKNGMCPLTAEPEIKTIHLTEDDEFLILACDGIWDVFRSQNAVDFARRKLQENNDPIACCKEIVNEALKRDSCDNLTAIVVCLQAAPPPRLSSVSRNPHVPKLISTGGRGLIAG